MPKILTLAERRERAKATLQQVAKATRLPYQTVQAHHAGNRIPKWPAIRRYAQYYKCSPVIVAQSLDWFSQPAAAELKEK